MEYLSEAPAQAASGISRHVYFTCLQHLAQYLPCGTPASPAPVLRQGQAGAAGCHPEAAVLLSATGSRLPCPQGARPGWEPHAAKARLCLWWGLREGPCWGSPCACLLLKHVLPRQGPRCRGCRGGSQMASGLLKPPYLGWRGPALISPWEQIPRRRRSSQPGCGRAWCSLHGGGTVRARQVAPSPWPQLLQEDEGCSQDLSESPGCWHVAKGTWRGQRGTCLSLRAPVAPNRIWNSLPCARMELAFL